LITTKNTPFPASQLSFRTSQLHRFIFFHLYFGCPVFLAMMEWYVLDDDDALP